MRVYFFLSVCKWAGVWLARYDADVDPVKMQNKSATLRTLHGALLESYLPPSHPHPPFTPDNH